MCWNKLGNVPIGPWMMTKRCPKEAKHFQKLSQMAAKRCPKRPKWRPKWTQNGVELASSTPKWKWRASISFFLKLLVHLGSQLGTMLVPSATKNINKKASENQGRKNIENHSQRSRKRSKCIPNRIPKSYKIGTCDFCAFSMSTT